jgi:DNA topoisomerase IA
LSPTIAMLAAENLYTSGYISYPRTETTAYPLTFDLHSELKEVMVVDGVGEDVMMVGEEGVLWWG